MRNTWSAAALLLLVLISACSSQDCSKVTCKVRETCANGQCFCQAGYDGDSCTNLSITKFINNAGTYQVSEACQSGSGGGSYVAYMQAGSRINEIQVINFLGQYNIRLLIIPTGDRLGNYVEVAPGEILGGSMDNTIEGQGNYQLFGTQARVTIQFNYRLAGVNYACTHTFYKQ